MSDNLASLYINGQWVASKSGRKIDIVSPDTGTRVTQVAEAGTEDVDLAVSAARTAFDHGPWPHLDVAERVAIIRRMTELLKSRTGDLQKAVRMEIGALPGSAAILTQWGIERFENALDVAETFPFVERRQSATADYAYVVHEPVGVVAAIAPWNAPLLSLALKVAPALLAGCTVVMKPSPEAPLEGYILAECAHEAGVPPGVLNLIAADRDAADHLVGNRDVDKVAFTGSTAVGRRIGQVCSDRVARFSLELGGKSAAIVLDDFDLHAAAKMLARTIAVHTGQICVTLSRVIVPQHRHDALVQAIADEMKQIKVGLSDDPATEMGPLASRRQLERVEAMIGTGVREGAELMFGGTRIDKLSPGAFIEPTLFANVTPDMTIAQEEIFGPVLVVMPCIDTDDAVRIANSTRYGLNGSVLTQDSEEAFRIARKIRSGSFGQNGLRGDFNLPFGGFGQSGIGREGGAEGLRQYMEIKTVFLDGPIAA